MSANMNADLERLQDMGCIVEIKSMKADKVWGWNIEITFQPEHLRLRAEKEQEGVIQTPQGLMIPPQVVRMMMGQGQSEEDQDTMPLTGNNTHHLHFDVWDRTLDGAIERAVKTFDAAHMASLETFARNNHEFGGIH